MSELNRMYGFKKALIGAIFTIVGFALVALAIIMLLLASLDVDIFKYIGGSAAVIWLIAMYFTIIPLSYTIVAIPLEIVGLIFGIKSISSFVYANRLEGVKPIVTLALGIASTIISVLVLIYICCAFIFIF